MVPRSVASFGNVHAASDYRGDPSDPIDMMLSWCLFSLDREPSSRLKIRRLAVGKYEIDGRQVSIKWSGRPDSTELFVREDQVADSRASEMPLLAYLSQAAHVAASLSGRRAGLPAVSRIPPEKRLTFHGGSEGDATANIDQAGLERVGSMRLACEQARIREQAAAAYESGIEFQPAAPGLPAWTLAL